MEENILEEIMEENYQKLKKAMNKKEDYFDEEELCIMYKNIFFI